MEQYIIEKGFATLLELSEHFNMSMNTTRRDVSELVLKGNVEKVYGGVSALKRQPELTPITERKTYSSREKNAIGKVIGTMVRDGMTIYVDSGSTTASTIAYIARRSNITIVTNCLTIMEEVAKYPSITLLGIGGMYQVTSTSFIGNSVIEELKKMRFDAVIVGATSIDPNGVSSNLYLEAEIKKQVVHSSNEVYLVADHSKYNKSASFNICSYKEIKYFVTDGKLDTEICTKMKSNGVQIICADV